MKQILIAAALAALATSALADTMDPRTVVPATARTVIADMTEADGENSMCAMYVLEGCEAVYNACVRRTVPKMMPHGRHLMLWQVGRIRSDVNTICNKQVVDWMPAGAKFR